MATRTVTRRTPKNGVAAKFFQFITLQAEGKALTKRQNELKEDLRAFAVEHGEEDENGSLIYEVEGVPGFAGFANQRRVSQKFNEDAAEALCEKKGFAKKDYISTTEYVDQDKIARLYAQDKITEEEFDSLMEETITWAFVPTKE